MPFVLSPFSLVMLCNVLVLAIACMGMNLVFGTAGLLSFGHATFFAISAYAGAFLCHFGRIGSFEIYLIFGVCFSALLAAVLGFLSIRATRIHFTILTLAFCQIIYSLFVNGTAFRLFGPEGWAIFLVTEGGMYIPRLTLLGTTVKPLAFIPAFYVVIVVGFVAAAVLSWRIDRSLLGLALRAIRDNDIRAAFVGVPVWRYRWYAFIVSGAFVGFAGGLYGQLNRQITPEQLDWLFSAKLVIAAVLGGSRRFLGPILGAALFIAIQETASNWLAYREMLLGALLIAAVFLFPDGLAGAAAAAAQRLRIRTGDAP